MAKGNGVPEANLQPAAKEADQAKTCLAAEIAGKAASAQHHSAQVSSESTLLLASKIKDLETKLQHVESEASECAQELSRAAEEASLFKTLYLCRDEPVQINTVHVLRGTLRG